MAQTWEKGLSCAVSCAACNGALAPDEKRILSVYDHRPICMACKEEEQGRPDYEAVSREMLGQCMIDTEVMYGDPGGYCFYHFYPFTCKSG
ncbi:MAG: hypothetical protein JRI76_13650 [Deltaproteobacteria bacterium]|nr:hypothetical protein [Deltaproteobacteria bacterium]MBW1956154.1 hypothetical protein [Deltaproteobacteria bacterium]MBW2043051.1 hypothetical protein [Deltaproteobacteria bacterium]MBW2132753.1 hypothetical protein [Deltaproteobacteria bacterium]